MYQTLYLWSEEETTEVRWGGRSGGKARIRQPNERMLPARGPDGYFLPSSERASELMWRGIFFGDFYGRGSRDRLAGTSFSNLLEGGKYSIFIYSSLEITDWLGGICSTCLFALEGRNYSRERNTVLDHGSFFSWDTFCVVSERVRW
jgi:hypothetical protein